MNYQSYFPSARLIDSLQNTNKKEIITKKPSNHNRNQSYVIGLSTTKITQHKENLYPVNTRNAKSKDVKQNTSNNNENNKFRNEEKNTEMRSEKIHYSPESKVGKINVVNNYNPKTSNFGEFNKNVIKQKLSTNPMKISVTNFSNKSKITNKTSNNESSYNAMSYNMVKSSNISFDKNVKEEELNIKNAKNIKEDSTVCTQSKSTNNLQKNIEVDSLEELHFFYVNLLKQNKGLAFKFEGLHDDGEFKENYEF